jgi:hypothetical protein
MHLDPEQLERALHQELGNDRAPAEEHLAACPACRHRVAQAAEEEEWIFDRLRALDHPAPQLQISRLVSPLASRRRLLPPQRWAAGIILTVAAAGVAYAAPGSPLRPLIHRVLGISAGPARHASPTSAAFASPAYQGGIAVAPGDHFVIAFDSALAGGRAKLTLTDGEDVIVRARDGAGFRSDVDRLVILPRTHDARFEIEIPRSAPAVEIRVAGVVIFRTEFSQIVTRAAPEKDGSYQLPLQPGP